MLFTGFFTKGYLFNLSVRPLGEEKPDVLCTYDGEMDVAGVQVAPTPTGET